MKKIEIGLNRFKIAISILPLFIGIFVVTYSVYFTSKFEHNQTIKWVIPFADLMALVLCYKVFVRYIENKPIITITEDSIEIHELKATFKWDDISLISFEKNLEKGQVMEIITKNSGRKEISISGLIKSPDEIAEIINENAASKVLVNI